MPNPSAAATRTEMESEKRLLLKAEADVESGWSRIRNQQDLVDWLRSQGHNTVQAERLVRLMEQTLIEWERHRVLIEQRIAYLQRKIAADQE